MYVTYHQNKTTSKLYKARNILNLISWSEGRKIWVKTNQSETENWMVRERERERVEGKGPRRIACSSRRRPEQSRGGSQVQSERERERERETRAAAAPLQQRMGQITRRVARLLRRRKRTPAEAAVAYSAAGTRSTKLLVLNQQK